MEKTGHFAVSEGGRPQGQDAVRMQGNSIDNIGRNSEIYPRMAVYSEFRTRKVQLYYHLIRSQIRFSRYLFLTYAGYRLFRHIYQEMAPYWPAKPGDTVIQVGAVPSLLKQGLSQPLIFSSIVGPSGRVIVIEPDPICLTSIKKYIDQNRITNITLISAAVWNVPGRQKFIFYRDNPGANVMSGATDTLQRHARKPQLGRMPEEEEIDTRRLDEIIRSHGLGKIDHINVTVNGTEFQVIESLSGCIDRIGSISFVFQGKERVNSPILEFLESHGFEIVVQHAPATLAKKQFLCGTAVRQRDEIGQQLFDRGFEATFEYSSEDKPIKIGSAPSIDNTD